MSRQSGKIDYGATGISYTISMSEVRKTIAVTVHPDGTVSVRAPKGIRQSTIGGVVHRKAGWILHQKEYFRRNNEGYPKKFVSGESLYYLGRQYKLKVKAANDVNAMPVVQLIRGQFLVVVSRDYDSQQGTMLIRQGLVDWYRCRAKQHIPNIADRYSRRLGISYATIRIYEMKKRWGSGGHSGRLAFDWRIMMAPRRLVEYVVAHELCHLKYNDHSRDFWRLLERVMPDHERRRAELAINGPRYNIRGTPKQ